MPLYLGNQKISGVLTEYSTTVNESGGSSTNLETSTINMTYSGDSLFAAYTDMSTGTPIWKNEEIGNEATLIVPKNTLVAFYGGPMYFTEIYEYAFVYDSLTIYNDGVAAIMATNNTYNINISAIDRV